MKIGDQRDVSATGENLLERMQEAHDEAKVASTGEAKTLGGTSVLDGARREATEVNPRSITVDPLEARLLALAQDVLDAKYDTPGEARAVVVSMILEEQSGPHLSADDREVLLETMQNALVEDPRFARQVDEMLIHAARCLGSEG